MPESVPFTVLSSDWGPLPAAVEPLPGGFRSRLLDPPARVRWVLGAHGATGEQAAARLGSAGERFGARRPHPRRPPVGGLLPARGSRYR